MLFSEKLKLLRKENDLTQEGLAEKLNVSRQAITKWECGEGLPDIENLKQISTLFDVSIDELVKEDIEVELKAQDVQELEIDHVKHFDIHMCKISMLNIKPNNEEKVKIEFLSNEDDIGKIFKVKFDDLYNKLDIDVKSKKDVKDVSVNLYIPEKYINDIDLNSKIKTLNISNLDLKKLEYDGTLKYLNVEASKGTIVLNTTRCDVEAKYDKLDGSLEVNTINSVSRVELPKDSEYKTVLKGKKNEIIGVRETENAKNTIELNGFNSKLIIIED